MNTMAIDEVKVRTRLEARHIELRREIAAMLDEEASLGQSGLGVEDMEEIAQILQEIRQDKSILLNQRHLLATIEEALRRLRDGTYGYCNSCGNLFQRNGSKPSPGQYGTEHARNNMKH